MWRLAREIVSLAQALLSGVIVVLKMTERDEYGNPGEF
jgi:hypothetical protein